MATKKKPAKATSRPVKKAGTSKAAADQRKRLFVEGFFSNNENITKAAVQRIAQQLLRADAMTVVVVGDPRDVVPAAGKPPG